MQLYRLRIAAILTGQDNVHAVVMLKRLGQEIPTSAQADTEPHHPSAEKPALNVKRSIK